MFEEHKNMLEEVGDNLKEALTRLGSGTELSEKDRKEIRILLRDAFSRTMTLIRLHEEFISVLDRIEEFSKSAESMAKRF